MYFMLLVNVNLHYIGSCCYRKEFKLNKTGISKRKLVSMILIGFSYKKKTTVHRSEKDMNGYEAKLFSYDVWNSHKNLMHKTCVKFSLMHIFAYN